MDLDNLDNLIDDAAERTIENGGGTFRADSLEPVNPTTGYAVAIGGETIELAHERGGDTRQAVHNLIWRVRDLNQNAPYIGTWIDGGIAYIDAVLILPDLASAYIVARAFDQKAIWDFANSASIEIVK